MNAVSFQRLRCPLSSCSTIQVHASHSKGQVYFKRDERKMLCLILLSKGECRNLTYHFYLYVNGKILVIWSYSTTRKCTKQSFSWAVNQSFAIKKKEKEMDIEVIKCLYHTWVPSWSLDFKTIL